jgi:hypothetical protein
MRRISGKMFWGVFVIAGLSGAAFGQSGSSQSLGDIARANRANQQAQEASGVTPKVFTNKDLPASASAGIPEENASDPMTTVSGVQRSFRQYARAYSSDYPNGGQRYGSRPFGQPSMGGQYAGDQLRGQIRQQENRVAELQARIDRASSSMHPNGSTVQYDGPLNRYQAIQAQRIEMMQQMLDQQRQKLAMMQDEARRAGMHTNVYEP